ncbi:MAG: sigma-70 family RNA polymerase sigma factor [Phycisphaerales bacterium]|nr:sigma-70 family RNA polymerase sigma factor [Phycisphaerales bacterium]
MPDPSPTELELTPDLLDYARRVALKEAPKHCDPRVSFDDAAHEAVLHLMSSPPKYDPSRGASPKTLIYTIVHRAVIKFAAREAIKVGRFRALPQSTDADDNVEAGVYADDRRPGPASNRSVELTKSRWTMDDVLQFIDNENSRALCRLVIECDGNVSEAARRLKLTEGAVRDRLRLLAPKLRAAGFDPDFTGGIT